MPLSFAIRLSISQVTLARLAADDRPQRGVRLHPRVKPEDFGINPDPLALHKLLLGDQLQHPAKHLCVHFARQARARFRQPGMVRHAGGRLQTQKLPERQAIAAAPLEPALRVDALEITHHVHPEVSPRRDRRRPYLRSVIGLAGRFRKGVETGLDQYLLQSIVKTCPGEHGISRHVTIKSLCRSPCRPSAIIKSPTQAAHSS
jgi:hypothetical protein